MFHIKKFVLSVKAIFFFSFFLKSIRWVLCMQNSNNSHLSTISIKCIKLVTCLTCDQQLSYYPYCATALIKYIRYYLQLKYCMYL